MFLLRENVGGPEKGRLGSSYKWQKTIHSQAVHNSWSSSHRANGSLSEILSRVIIQHTVKEEMMSIIDAKVEFT